MNPKSTILLLILVSIVLFMIGINLGKQIERSDKKYDAMLSITPAPTMASPTNPPLSFKSYMNKGCGVSLVLPKTMVEKTASLSASITEGSNLIKLSCDPKVIQEFTRKKGKTNEKDLQEYIYGGRTITGIRVKDRDLFTLVNSTTGKTILFETSQNMTDLVLKSVEFTK